MSATTDEPAGNTALGIARRYFGTQHPLFRVMGVDIVGVEKGRAECSMPCTPAMQDHRGALHRGAMVTLLDNTCGLAIFAALGTVKPIATIDLRVDYLRPLPPGAGIRCIVECIARTETVAFISGRALTLDEASIPLAAVSGSFAIDTLGPPLDGFLPKVSP